MSNYYIIVHLCGFRTEIRYQNQCGGTSTYKSMPYSFFKVGIQNGPGNNLKVRGRSTVFKMGWGGGGGEGESGGAGSYAA